MFLDGLAGGTYVDQNIVKNEHERCAGSPQPHHGNHRGPRPQMVFYIPGV